MSDLTPTAEDPVKTEAGEIAKEVLHDLNVIGPLIPIQYVPWLLSLGDKYGPEIIDRLEVIFTKKGPVSWDDLRAVYANLRPYESFGIPDVAPKPPAS